MRFKSRRAVRQEIFSMSEIYVSAHDDADGIASTLLFSEAMEAVEVEVEVEFPEYFGHCEEGSNVILDQVPIDPDIDALVIDHHSEHLSRRGYTYRLWYDIVPASLMVYNLFKKEITSKWKVAIGLVGDGQPELIPIEIWKQYPELLQMKASLYQRGYEITVYRNPLYTMLSSGINAIARNPESSPVVAYDIAKEVKSPWELVIHPTCENAKVLSKKEQTRIINTHVPLDLGNIMYWEIESGFGVESTLASRLEGKEKKTVIVVNGANGKVSIRGVLAPLIKNKLSEFAIGGHSKYMGGILSDDQSPDDLLKALVERF